MICMNYKKKFRMMKTSEVSKKLKIIKIMTAWEIMKRCDM